jgi:hypothetical protein
MRRHLVVLNIGWTISHYYSDTIPDVCAMAQACTASPCIITVFAHEIATQALCIYGRHETV